MTPNEFEDMFKGLRPDQAEDLANRIRTVVLGNTGGDVGAAIGAAYSEFKKTAGIEKPVLSADQIDTRDAQLSSQLEQLMKNPHENWAAIQQVQTEIAALDGEIEQSNSAKAQLHLQQSAGGLATLQQEAGSLAAEYEQLAIDPAANFARMQEIRGQLDQKLTQIDLTERGVI